MQPCIHQINNVYFQNSYLMWELLDAVQQEEFK